MTMTLAQALEVAEQASPMPYVAHEALQVLIAELRRANPPGFKLVPVEPTEAMLLNIMSWADWLRADSIASARRNYAAMLTAAPEVAE